MLPLLNSTAVGAVVNKNVPRSRHRRSLYMNQRPSDGRSSDKKYVHFERIVDATADIMSHKCKVHIPSFQK